MHSAHGMPVVAAERRMDLSALAAVRGDVPWAALFVRAFARVAARRPELRRSYQSYPWPHLYEADRSVASVAVAREFEGESAVFFGLIDSPDRLSLPELAERLLDFKTLPIESVRPFARLVRYTRYPRPVRRVVWWLGLNLSGKHRARTIGTFGLSTVAGAGSSLLNLISPIAFALNYGPIDSTGMIEIRLNFDHRVLDGLTAAEALKEMEVELNLVEGARGGT